MLRKLWESFLKCIEEICFLCESLDHRKQTVLEEALISEVTYKNSHRYFPPQYIYSCVMWCWSSSHTKVKSISPPFESETGYVSGFGQRSISKLVHNDLPSCYIWKSALTIVPDDENHNKVTFSAPADTQPFVRYVSEPLTAGPWMSPAEANRRTGQQIPALLIHRILR